MKISEICRLTGLTPRAVRLYTEKGLISPSRTPGLHRDSLSYSEDDLRRLRAIAELRSAGFSLEDIGRMLARPAETGEIVSAHRNDLARRVRERELIYNTLRDTDIASCPDICTLADQGLKNVGKCGMIEVRYQRGEGSGKGETTMDELINEFLRSEVTHGSYGELWSFVKSGAVCRGSYEGQSFMVLKLSAKQFIIYRLSLGGENAKPQPAVVLGRNYLLKKINSRAYDLHLPDIQNILD